VNGTTAFAIAKYQAAMSTHIFGIIFNDFAMFNDTVYFRRGNQPLWSRHLPDSMREKQKTLSRSLPNQR
jgi:hypothetical protein